MFAVSERDDALKVFKRTKDNDSSDSPPVISEPDAIGELPRYVTTTTYIPDELKPGDRWPQSNFVTRCVKHGGLSDVLARSPFDGGLVNFRRFTPIGHSWSTGVTRHTTKGAADMPQWAYAIEDYEYWIDRDGKFRRTRLLSDASEYGGDVRLRTRSDVMRWSLSYSPMDQTMRDAMRRLAADQVELAPNQIRQSFSGPPDNTGAMARAAVTLLPEPPAGIVSESKAQPVGLAVEMELPAVETTATAGQPAAAVGTPASLPVRLQPELVVAPGSPLGSGSKGRRDSFAASAATTVDIDVEKEV